MASDLQQYEPLRTMVAYALDEMGKSGGDEDRAWLFAFRGLSDMHFQFTAEPETVRLNVQGNKTVPFPSYCLGINKVGVLNADGELCSLKANNALTTWRDDNPNRLQDLANVDVNNSVGALSTIPWFVNYYYNGSYYNLFGVGPGLVTYGSYQVDQKNRVIILEPNFAYDQVLVEMITAPERNADYMVPVVLRESIIAFIKWKFKQGTAQEYYDECIKARRTMPKKKFVLSTANQVLRESDAMKLRS